ncbi:chromate efflux transporter [Anaerorhabdus furcosa]|uniref:Chromate transporter n=1 Tax=Anaerorhabdus furcosa TaxID=118967 RepID=A0A1T4MCD3_9FIRM|nr:chromate efflux transporter [Anaerorhabdus furcosa]SJZ64700.1 chromate transporter [Anaerorhabdus furcosa]
MQTTHFLLDVFICSLGAYGGPEAHFGIFYSQLVHKKNYLSEEELVELNALCSILPGPTSTQTITAIGYKVGGKLLAFLTLLVWALPVLILMTVLALIFPYLESNNLSIDFLRYLAPMAIAFVLFAGLNISKKVLINKSTVILAITSALLTYFIQATWLYPVLLLCGGVLMIYLEKPDLNLSDFHIKPSWKFLIFFFVFAIGSYFLMILTGSLLATLFYEFYRFGYLVFGGGQVVVPLMISEFVDHYHFLSQQEFLIGYGLIQGLPGPMFGFSSFVGGLAARDTNLTLQIISGLLSGVSIFLPGVLLIYFIYPMWDKLRQVKAIKVALKGISAVACGLLLKTAFTLLFTPLLPLVQYLFILFFFILLYTKKIPAPALVVLAILLGFIN